jgi:hypothetical protein
MSAMICAQYISLITNNHNSGFDDWVALRRSNIFEDIQSLDAVTQIAKFAMGATRIRLSEYDL